MNKKLLFAGLLSLGLSQATHAMPTNQSYSVSFDGAQVGTLSLRNKVEDLGDSCRYTVRWMDINKAPLSRTRLCKIDEIKAGDNFDCEENRRSFFDTLVQKDARYACHGFDDFGQETDIDTLIAGEGADGTLEGIVSSANVSDVQNLVIR